MTIDRLTPSGAIQVSDLVTDGVDTWFHRLTFFDYSEGEARALYAEDLRERGYTVVG